MYSRWTNTKKTVGNIVPGILFGLFQGNDFFPFLISPLLKPNPAPQQTSVIKSRTVGPADRPNRSTSWFKEAFILMSYSKIRNSNFNTWAADKNLGC